MHCPEWISKIFEKWDTLIFILPCSCPPTLTPSLRPPPTVGWPPHGPPLTPCIPINTCMPSSNHVTNVPWKFLIEEWSIESVGVPGGGFDQTLGEWRGGMYKEVWKCWTFMVHDLKMACRYYLEQCMESVQWGSMWGGDSAESWGDGGGVNWWADQLQFIQCMLHDTTALEHSNSKTQKCDNKKSEIWPLEGVNFSRFPDEKIPGNGKKIKSKFPGISRSGISRD